MKRELEQGPMWRNKLLTGLPVVQALLVMAVFGLARPAQAEVIYSNLGPGDSFLTSPGTYPVWNLTSGGFIERAASFTVPGTEDVVFTSADLGFHLQSGT